MTKNTILHSIAITGNSFNIEVYYGNYKDTNI